MKEEKESKKNFRPVFFDNLFSTLAQKDTLLKNGGEKFNQQQIICKLWILHLR